MPVPTLVTDLSTTLASNSPSGSDNVFPDLDNYLRALSGFVASIRDNSGNGWVSPYLPLTYSAGTANGVVYLNGSKVVTTGSALVFDGSNLGLGVTPSAWGAAGQKAFQLAGLGAVSGGYDYSISASNNAMRVSGGGWQYMLTGQLASLYQQISGTHTWSTAPSGTAGNAISFTQAMTLDASGNLLTGVTSQIYPSANRRTVEVNGTSQALFGLGVGGTSAGYWLHDGTDMSLYQTRAGSLLFGTNNTERARITSGGSLLVGTTGISSYRFEVTSSGNTGLFQTTSGTSWPCISWSTATTGDNLFYGFFTEGTATERGRIDYNRAGGLTRYNTTSDYRAKDIIGPVQNPGATIDALKVYEGVMKGATQSRPMLIAHEAQEHVPFCVSGEKDEENPDGSPKFQQMDHASLVPLLLAEIQSLRARVAALEAA